MVVKMSKPNRDPAGKGRGYSCGSDNGCSTICVTPICKKSKGLSVAVSPDDAFKFMSFFRPYVKDHGKL